LLMQVSTGISQTHAADMHVTTFGKSTVLVVFRDVSQGHIGRALIGKVRDGDDVVMAPAEAFSGQHKAYSPVAAGTDNQRMVVAWRDEHTGGLCWMRGAALDTSGIGGAPQQLTWGEAVNFCQGQSHKMAVLPLPGNRMAIFFADKIKASTFPDGSEPEMGVGNALLLDVGGHGDVATLSTSRFADYPVVRLEVTQLTPKTFVLAGRAVQATDDMDPSVQIHQEALAFFGEVSEDNIIFDSNTLNLEPKDKHIWARGVSLIAPNTFAYAYQHGKDLQIKLAVAKMNPTTGQMETVHKPSVIKEGFSPYVSMISAPYSASDPHTLTYYQGATGSMVNVCSWDPVELALSRCEDFSWLQGKVESISAAHLGRGRSFMAFTSESGVPYYSIFGLSKK